MWWLRYRKLLEYLDKSEDSKEKKEQVISKKQNRIKNEISKLQHKELIYYLFDSKIPTNAKKLIVDRIDEILNAKDENNNFQLVMYLKAQGVKQIEFKKLYRDFGKNNLTLTLVDDIYSDSLKSIVFDKKLNTDTKKMLIDLKFNSKDICGILEKLDIEILLQKNVNEYKELIDYIISSHTYDHFEMGDVIRSEKVPKYIKIELIKKQINISNITDMLSIVFLPDEVKETIYELKGNVINEYIKNLDEKTIIDYYDGFHKESSLSSLIFERRKSLLVSIIKKTETNKLYSLISKTRYQKIADLVSKLREEDLIKCICNTQNNMLLLVLDSDYLTDRQKEILFQTRRAEIEEQINNKSGYELIKIIKSDSSPSFLKELILSNRKDTLIEEIYKIKEEDLKLTILYSGFFSYYYEPYVKLVIELRVNENNLYRLLKEGNIYEDKTKILIKYKNDLIRKKIKTIDFETLARTSTEIKQEIVDYILELNKDLIDEIVRKQNFDLSDVGLLIIKEDVNLEVKKSLLRTHNINEDNLSSIIELIKAGNSVLVMERYDDIKKFVESLGVSFKAFMQYGSGSTTYKSWLSKVFDIIDNNKSKEFLEVCRYFFKNFYYEDNSKENNVYVIKNLQEIIYNYYNYHELFLNLVKNNIEITDTLKQDLKHLFASTPQSNINTLEDLKNFRMNSYLSNKKALEEPDKLTNGKIKTMFNDIFGNTDILFNIGGSEGLENLKRYNKNNRFLCAYIDEILKYVRIIELVRYSNDRKSLIDTLKYLYEGTFEDYTNLQNEFSSLQRKIQHLYELDSRMNLTNIEESCKIDGVINKKLSKKYTGKVLDFSDKNYCLYAHILSYSENIEDVLKGISSGKNNFISLSPISCYGQKYYYGYDKMILLYDEIKEGSFICSSLYNFGSNKLIKENSSEVQEKSLIQKGILETSAVTKNNAEALFYREGLVPKALALPGGRTPTEQELLYHKKYNLPFVITQEIASPVENAKQVFKPNTKYTEPIIRNKKIERTLELLSPKINIIKETSEYTGREIGLFTDSHALFEPTSAILEDMRKYGITEIYSLGDNVGSGPNPDEIIDMLEYYKVSSIMGNTEYYNTLGTRPFEYLGQARIENQEWTKDKLGSARIEKMKLWTPSIDLTIGNKKIALCHFANDVRWDYGDNSTWSYQTNFEIGKNSEQFRYTNSEKAKREIQNKITSHRKDTAYIKALLDAQKDPIFNGKKVTDYDAIIQGHVHFAMEDLLDDTYIHTLRSCSMGYQDDNKDYACYYILKERKDGNYDIVKKLVPFNRNMMLSNIKASTMPNKERILSWTS